MKSSFVAALALASFSIFAGGCSSSSGGTSAPADGGGTSNQKTADDFCATIPQADAQALLSATIISVDGQLAENVYDCNYVVHNSTNVDDDTQLTFYESDADKKHFNNIKTNFPDSPAQDLGGVGDSAYWLQAGPDQGPPSMASHQGNRTCVVQVTGNLDLTNLPHPIPSRSALPTRSSSP